jgi:hypothetical protein
MRTGSGRPNITCQNLGCYHAGTWRLNLRCIVSSAISQCSQALRKIRLSAEEPRAGLRPSNNGAPGVPARPPRPSATNGPDAYRPLWGLCARQNCPMLETVADPDGGCVPRIDVGDSSRGSFPSSTLDYATPDRQILAAGPVCGDARAVCSGSIGALPARTLCADAAGCADAKYAFLPPPRGSRGPRAISIRPHQQK